MITMQSWMFLSSYEALRKKILNQKTIISMAHLGARAFDSIGGEIVSTTAFILKNTHDSKLNGNFYRLVEGVDEAEKASSLIKAIQFPNCNWSYNASTIDFNKIPGSPIAYWASEKTREIFSKAQNLGTLVEPRQGMATTDNKRFLRYWHEVNINKIDYRTL